MELVNATKMRAGYTMGMQPDGRELLVVVAKATFMIPKAGEEPQLASEQTPIIDADAFTGEPGFSAPLYESDYAPLKPRCDVLLNGSAYAPGGRPVERITVSLSVGEVQKQFDVVGDRVWRNDFGVGVTQPQPFLSMPISYDRAFGGEDNLDPDPSRHDAYLPNPVGKGFFPKSKPDQITGKPLPNTEESGRPVNSPASSYRSMSLGPIGRNWTPRPKYAGTYDQNWIDNVFPFLPEDFQNDYYQCAPEDQQCDYLRGGEEVVLRNLTPGGHVIFRLPSLEVPVRFYLKTYEEKDVTAVCDTLMIEPDMGRFIMVWRTSLSLRRNMFEVAQVVVGRMSNGWYRARELGKIYYRSLGALVNVRRAERAEAGQAEEEPEEAETEA